MPSSTPAAPTIAQQIKQIARGKHGAQHLSREDARHVFHALLAEDADPLQLGAFLIGERIKGETSAELAGFVEAARAYITGFGTLQAPKNAVDLPCYAGKRRAPHTYLAAALKARDSGIPILIHGIDPIPGRVTAWQILRQCGVARAHDLSDAQQLLQRAGIAYIDLAELCPALHRIYLLRERLGVRTCANTVARLLNPLRCRGQLNGFFHPPYADYMAGANRLLAQPRSLLFMGAEGEPELYADRQKLILCQQQDHQYAMRYPAANTAAYPRSAIDLALLEQQSLRIIAGEETEPRQQAVMQRMHEAFSWAASGTALETVHHWHKLTKEEQS